MTSCYQQRPGAPYQLYAMPDPWRGYWQARVFEGLAFVGQRRGRCLLDVLAPEECERLDLGLKRGGRRFEGVRHHVSVELAVVVNCETRITECPVGVAHVDAIWISHLHPDHWADLLAAWNAYANDDTLPRPTVFGPPGWAGRLDAALGQEGAAAKVFDVVQLDDRLKTTIGPIELQAFAMHHSVPTFGVRAEVNGRVLAYSADTGPCDALVELGQGADVLVVEAGADEPAEFHCTPEDVARATTTRAPGQVVLTHLAPSFEVSTAVDRFRSGSSLPVDVAVVGLRLAVKTP